MRPLKTSLAILLVATPLQAGAYAQDSGAYAYAPAPSASLPVQDALRSALQAVGGAEAARLDQFYASLGYDEAWRRSGGWSDDAITAIRMLRDADRLGLDPRDYRPDHLEAALAAARDDRTIARVDVALSAAVLRFFDQAAHGRLDPSEVRWNVHQDRDLTLPQRLAGAITGGRFAAEAAAVQLVEPRLRALLDARDRYRVLAEEPYPMLPDGPSLAIGDNDSRVPVLREQLTRLGDLAETAPVARAEQRQAWAPTAARGARVVLASAGYGEAGGLAARTQRSSRFDAGLEDAVRRFQARHGLEVDGVVGPATRAALNTGPRMRLRQIEANLERLRWMPADLGDHHIVVNIPAFELKAVENGRVVDRMRVVVGEPDWQTPVLSDEIVDLKFAPTWTIPYNIAREETLPRLRRDPGYLDRKGIRVLQNGRPVDPWGIDWHSTGPGDYVFRQEPGAGNALGQIRFSLTNDHDIYLHDTPSTRYFRQANRALSHGCIRVERPEDLAMFVLGDGSGWDKARLRSAMNAPRTHFHHLDNAVPVYLVYLTAWAEPTTGEIQFRQDVYGRDDRLAAALERRTPEALPLI